MPTRLFEPFILDIKGSSNYGWLTLANIQGTLSMQVNILEAKNNLSSLIVAAERDEEVVIARNGVPVAKLVKFTANKVAAPGAWKNHVAYDVDWNTTETNVQVEHLFTQNNNAPAA